MGKVDNLEQAEDDRKAEAQQGVKGTINNPDQQLAGQHGDGDA